MKNYFLCFLVLILFFAFTFSIAVGDDHIPVIRVGCYENAPKIYTDENGSVSGFWPALLKHIAAEEGWEIQWVAGTWHQGLERLENGQIDIMPDTGWTEPRSRKYDFSEVMVLQSWSQLYVPRDSKIEYILDLDGKTVAGLKGSVNLEGPKGIREIAHSFNLEVTFLEMESYEQVFEALEKRTIDAGVTNKEFGSQHEDEYAVEKTPIIFQPARLQFAFTKNTDLTSFLIKKIDGHMKRLKEDKNSIYYQALEKYIGSKQAETFIEIIPEWIKTGVLIGCGVILFLVSVGIVSRIQVRRRTFELQESEHRLSSHLKSTPVGALAWDLNFKIIDWNPAAENIFGYTKEEAIGKHATELILPEDMKELVNGVFMDLLSEKGGTRSTNENITKDGKRIFCDWYNTAIEGIDGKVTGMASLVNDITELKKAEESLRQSEKKYRSMMGAMEDAIYICSSEFYIEYMNPAMIKRTGYDATGESCHKVIHSLDKKCPWCVHEKVIKGEHINYEILSPKDNKTYHISDSPIFHTDESVSKLTIFRDFTEFKKMESQIQQSQKMESIGTLAGGIAHDFNNILFPVLGYAEMLLEDTPEDSPSWDSLNQIYTSALRAKSLVKQILTFSRQGSSELMLMKMQPVVKEALKLIRSTIPTTIEIKQDIHPDCGVIKADPTQIHQIVMNLATNAYHAMEETGGELKVRLKEIELGEYDILRPDMKPGIYACLTITDTGRGMDKKLTRKVFDPFFTTKEKGKGTGMGLSVVHGIVTNMNGAIQVYSEPGEGTQFHVYLPVEKNLSEEQVIHSKIEIQSGTEQILLVDDEEAILSMEKRMLERLGYQVTSRTSSLEALEAFRANPDKFDLIITDMQMPSMPGDKLSAELIKIRPGISILLCTGFSETMSEERAASLGIKGFLWKPIIMKDLAHKIREVLDKK